MAVVDQKRPWLGMLETFSRFLGHCRSVSARTVGFNVTDSNTDSRGGVGVIDYTPRRGYNLSVLMIPYANYHRVRRVAMGGTQAW
jgi:hypothetical protein